MTGRPTDYCDEVADKILDGIVGGATLRTICEPDDMPDKSTVLRWVARHEDFEKLYTLAQAAKMEAHADELLDIADDGSNDWMLTNAENNAGYRENGEAIRRSALRISTRQWLMERLKPKRYGSKVDVNHGGSVGLSVEVVDFGPPTS